MGGGEGLYPNEHQINSFDSFDSLSFAERQTDIFKDQVLKQYYAGKIIKPANTAQILEQALHVSTYISTLKWF